MRVVGDYNRDGYALIEGLIAPESAAAFVAMLKNDIGPNAIPVSGIREFPNLLARPAFEIYGHFYPPMLTFLWGLTPIVSEVVGRDLLPTYDYLRIYRDGDVCRDVAAAGGAARRLGGRRRPRLARHLDALERRLLARRRSGT